MKVEDGIGGRARSKRPVIAALETRASLRRYGRRTANGDGNGNAGNLDEIDRAVAVVEVVSARIEANEFNAADRLLAAQALALDAMFNNLAQQGALEDMRLALRAQSQSRKTLRALISLKTPHAEKVSRKRTDQNVESQA